MSALTQVETQALMATAEVMNRVSDISRQNKERYPLRGEVAGDYVEVQQAMHVIQHHIMRSALAREHPDIVRPFGMTLDVVL